MTTAINGLQLPHKLELESESGISEKYLENFFSVDETEAAALGFIGKQKHSGWVAKINPPDRSNGLYILKPDVPRLNDQSKPVKYEWKAGLKPRIDIAFDCIDRTTTGNDPVIVVEGSKKLYCLRSHLPDYCAMSLPSGVYGFLSDRKPLGDLNLVNWRDRDVFIAYDNDIAVKPEVGQAMRWLKSEIVKRGGNAHVVFLPTDSGEKLGPDDFIVKYGAAEFLRYVYWAANSIDDLITEGCNAADVPARQAIISQIAKRLTLVDSVTAELYCKAVGDSKLIGVREFKRLLNRYRPNESAGQQEGHVVHDGAICIRSIETLESGKEIETYSKLCNFSARVTADIAKDNGEEVTRFVKISGSLEDGQKLAEIEIPASKFTGLKWITEEWGTKPIVRAGNGINDQLREAIQRLSDAAESQYCYTHLGWRAIDGKRVYLSNSGAIGLDNVSVDMESEFENYSIPLAADDPRAAMRASLKFLDIAPYAVTIPIWASVWLAPLSSIHYSPFILWLYGTTGSRKSTLAALALNHYGEKFNDTLLPADWWATTNSLEKMLFLAKDALFVIDDYRPESDPYKRRELEASAARIIRHIGNRSGRGRMNQDTTLRATYRPRGFVMSTGEQLPTGRSVFGRMFVTEIRPGDVDIDKLSTCQNESDIYPHAMSGYLQWIQENWSELSAELPKVFQKLRRGYQQSDSHSRLSTNIASLEIGLYCGLRYAVEIGALSEAKYNEIMTMGRETLSTLAETQSKLASEEKPTHRFLSVIASLICQQKVSLEDRNDSNEGIGGYPGKAERIGYCDNESVYLLPSASFNVVSRYCQAEGYHFPVTQRTLKKELLEDGFTQAENTRTTTRLRISGDQVAVIKIGLDALEEFSPADDLPRYVSTVQT